MEIEDIINQVRYTGSEAQNYSHEPLRSGRRERSLSFDVKPVPDPRGLPQHSHLNGQATHESDLSRSVVGRRHRKKQCPQQSSQVLSIAQQRTPGGIALDNEFNPVPKLRSPDWPKELALSAAWYHMAPNFVPAYTIVPAYIPSQSHIAPLPQKLPPQQRLLNSTAGQDQHVAKSNPRGVPLPPLPESLRRSRPKEQKRIVPQKKLRKRERLPPVVRQYDHLSIEEAIEELARRRIDSTHLQDTAARKIELVRLLQRADRNNNRGGKSTPNDMRRV